MQFSTLKMTPLMADAHKYIHLRWNRFLDAGCCMQMQL